MKILYVSWWGNIKWGQKYKCHCQRVSAVTFCWCVLFMFFNMYVWRNDIQYLWSSLERDCTKLLSIQQLFISVWSLERGLCRYACAVESVCLPVLVPLCVPVLIRRVKNIQKKQTWNGFQLSDWSTTYPNSQSERRPLRPIRFSSV